MLVMLVKLEILQAVSSVCMVDMICACWFVCSLATCTVLSETSVRHVLL